MTHDNKPIQDSWKIAVYLEENFPDTPSLFHGNMGVHKFFYDYISTNVLIPLFKLVVLNIAKNAGTPEVIAWFRENREKKFGRSLETFAGNPDENLATVKQVLAPIHNVLKEHTFVTGDIGNL